MLSRACRVAVLRTLDTISPSAILLAGGIRVLATGIGITIFLIFLCLFAAISWFLLPRKHREAA